MVLYRAQNMCFVFLLMNDWASNRNFDRQQWKKSPIQLQIVILSNTMRFSWHIATPGIVHHLNNTNMITTQSQRMTLRTTLQIEMYIKKSISLH